MQTLLWTSANFSVMPSTRMVGISPDTLVTAFGDTISGALGALTTGVGVAGVGGAIGGTPASTRIGGLGPTCAGGSLSPVLSVSRTSASSRLDRVGPGRRRSGAGVGAWTATGGAGGGAVGRVTGGAAPTARLLNVAANAYWRSISAVSSCVHSTPAALVTSSWCGPAGILTS